MSAMHVIYLNPFVLRVNITTRQPLLTTLYLYTECMSIFYPFLLAIFQLKNPKKVRYLY